MVAATVFALSVLADAAGGDTADASRTVALRGDLGLASAVGFAGVTVTFAPTSRVLIEAGTGYGLSGVQASLMPKVVFGSGAHRFTTGFGASVGYPGMEIVTFSPTDGNGKDRVVTPWLNADLAGYDYRAPDGFSFIIAAGATMALAHGCARSLDTCVELYGAIFPQLRMGFGYWF